MNIRIMTCNVWADVFGNPVKERDERLVKVISRHLPDAVCFQEMHPHWHDCELQKGVFPLGYAPVEADLGDCTLNYTPIYYRKDKFEVVSSFFHYFTGPNDFNSKSATAVRLRSRETGEEFGVMATHFYFEENEKGNLARIENAKELVACAKKLCAGKPFPVFAGGDLNCDLLSEPYRVLDEGGLKSSVLLTECRENPVATWYTEPVYHPETDSYTPATVSPNGYEYALDHILVNGAVRVKKYTVDIGEDGRIVSDHRPVIVDAEI